MLRRKVAPPERIKLLRPGVHRVRHANCFNDPQHSISIVTSGRLDDFDAYAAVLRAFAAVLAQGYDCAFFVIGQGRAEHSLRALAQRLELSEQLTFADSRPAGELPGILKAADVYVSAAGREGLDMEALLAMAAGVPVLTARQPASDFLIADETVVTFDSGDADDLAGKLISVLEDRPFARDQAERALAHLGEHHSPTLMIAKLAEAYRQALVTGD